MEVLNLGFKWLAIRHDTIWTDAICGGFVVGVVRMKSQIKSKVIFNGKCQVNRQFLKGVSYDTYIV